MGSAFLGKLAGYFFRGGTAPTSLQAWVWNATNKYWEPGSPVPAFGAAGYPLDVAAAEADGSAALAARSDHVHAHPASQHQSGGAMAIKLDDLATPDDNTDLDVSTSRHGLTPKAPNSTTSYLRGDATWSPVTITPTLSTRTVAVNTAYQPSTTQDVLVYVSVQIDTGAAGDGKIEAMVDSSNPPTTVQMTFRVGTALTIIGAQLVFFVKAGNYYRLTTTNTAGTPTFTVVGSAPEVSF